MRAVYLPEQTFANGGLLEVIGDKFHHLVNVTRIKEGQSLLVMRGAGEVAKAEVIRIDKKKAILEIHGVWAEEDKRFIDLIVGTPKREAFDEVLKLATECGFARLYPFHSEYAQSLKINEKRVSRVLESAMIQSNNPFGLEIMDSLNDLTEVERVLTNYERCYLATAHEVADEEREFQQNGERKKVLIVGPEGGFSEREEKRLTELCHVIHLPSYILRTPHALAACFGWICHEGN